MPLARYFMFVGGVLLALLFIVGAELPKQPAVEIADTAAELPTIRIHTDRKWPEPVVFDTNISAETQPTIMLLKGASAQPAPANTADGSPPDLQAKARVREAFAQFQLAESKQAQHVDPKKPEMKRPVKRRVARRHAPQSTILIAQQPTFGFFGKSIW